jgi:hypothetical protein
VAGGGETDDDVWLVEEADRRRRAASHAAADALSIVCPAWIGGRRAGAIMNGDTWHVRTSSEHVERTKKFHVPPKTTSPRHRTSHASIVRAALQLCYL